MRWQNTVWLFKTTFSTVHPAPPPRSTLTPLNANIWLYYWVRWSLAIKHLYSESVSTLSQLLHVLCWIGVLQSESKHLLVSFWSRNSNTRWKHLKIPSSEEIYLHPAQPKWDNRHSQNIFENYFRKFPNHCECISFHNESIWFYCDNNISWNIFWYHSYELQYCRDDRLVKVPLLNLRDLKLVFGISVS